MKSFSNFFIFIFSVHGIGVNAQATVTTASNDGPMTVWMYLLIVFAVLSVIVGVLASYTWWRQRKARINRKKSAGLPVTAKSSQSGPAKSSVPHHISMRSPSTSSTLNPVTGNSTLMEASNNNSLKYDAANSITYTPGSSTMVPSILSRTGSLYAASHRGSEIKDLPPLPTGFNVTGSKNSLNNSHDLIPNVSSKSKNLDVSSDNLAMNTSSDVLIIDTKTHRKKAVPKSPVSPNTVESMDKVPDLKNSSEAYKSQKKKDGHSRGKTPITLNVHAFKKPPTENSESSHLNTVTLSSTNYPLSVPGFLKMEFAKDYFEVANAVVASDSSSIMSHGTIVDPKCLDRNDKVSDCVVKRFKDIENKTEEEMDASFLYEVAVVAALRGCGNVARFLGYSDFPRVIVMKKYNLTLNRLLFGDNDGTGSSKIPDAANTMGQAGSNGTSFRSTSSLNMNAGTLLMSILANRRQGSVGNVTSSSNNIGQIDVWMTPPIAWRIAMDIAKGMRALHKHAVIHLDLKPESILVQINADSSFYCVISGFGNASILGSEVKCLKKPNVSKLTYPYASPEMFTRVFSGRDVAVFKDMSIDVYAFGITLYEVISQRMAWESHSPVSVETRVKLGERPAIPAEIIESYANSRENVILDLMQKCWSQCPDDRPTFESICRSLDDIGSISEQQQHESNVN